MNENILAHDDETELTAAFGRCCDDPHACDVSFQEEREATGFANFGFDPDEATRLREEELARIAAELESEPLDYEDEDEDEDDGLDDDDDLDIDDDLVFDDDDDDDDYDRFSNHLSLDDDEDEDDDWYDDDYDDEDDDV